jgi:branched-chain amino acid transport system permease protein
VSCALAGVAGGIQALFVSYVTGNSTFNITVPLTVVLMSVLGGTRSFIGPALGAAIITALLYATTAADQAIAGKAVVGAVLLVAVLFMPDGLLGLVHARAKKSGAAKVAPTPAPEAKEDARDHVSRVAAAASAAGPRHALHPDAGTARVLLAVRGVRKSFRGVRALDGVDLDVHDGEILGVLGPNGSGKSTLINVVSGHYRRDAGTIAFNGNEIAALPAHRIARAGIARTYQIPRPFAHLSARDNVALAAMFGGGHLRTEDALGAADTWLAFTGLARHAHALPGALNLHQTKFLELARALAARPKLVLLDEVLSGLTPGEIDEAVELIRRIRDQGTTIVLVEHVMRVVTALSDRVVVLDQGRLLASGSFEAVMARREVALAYLGTAHA